MLVELRGYPFTKEGLVVLPPLYQRGARGDFQYLEGWDLREATGIVVFSLRASASPRENSVSYLYHYLFVFICVHPSSGY